MAFQKKAVPYRRVTYSRALEFLYFPWNPTERNTLKLNSLVKLDYSHLHPFVFNLVNYSINRRA